MIQGYSGFGRSASASALHSKNQKVNPLKNQYGDSNQKNGQTFDPYNSSNGILKDYIYGSGKKRQTHDLEYTIPATSRGSN